MMEKAPFSELLLQAWRASSPKAGTFIFGVLVASGMAAEQLAIQAFGQPVSESFAAWLRDAWTDHTVVVSGVFLGMLLIHMFGQANLIVALSHRKVVRFRMVDMAERFAKAVSIDLTAGVALGILALVFATPSLVALSNNRGAFEGAALLGVFAFLPVVCAVLFIRQYGLFYLLLSSLRFRSSIDQGTALFLKFFLRSIAFFIFSFAIAVVFTFFLNAAMLGTSSLFTKVGFGYFSRQAALGIGFVGFVWYTVFDQALSLGFFEDIASGKDTAKSLPEEQRVLDPGMPAV
jgi:hypothetical protein